METWVMREMGAAWDPERFCPYTGQAVHCFPLEAPGHVMQGYWREDGELMRVRELTPEEKSWLDAFPQDYIKQAQAFHAWLDTTRKKTT